MFYFVPGSWAGKGLSGNDAKASCFGLPMGRSSESTAGPRATEAKSAQRAPIKEAGSSSPSRECRKPWHREPLRPPVSLVDDTVCAAIPCTHAHWGPLLRRSLDSVAKQTRRVDRVVVVLSLVGLKPDEFKKMCAARQTELSTWHANATLVCTKAKHGPHTRI